jgi:hypothetical protein
VYLSVDVVDVHRAPLFEWNIANDVDTAARFNDGLLYRGKTYARPKDQRCDQKGKGKRAQARHA